MKRAYAYRRKSRVFRDKNAVSPEMQLDEIRALAARHGDTELVVLEDMNVSGKKGRAKRPGFDALLTAVEAGEVSAIYSYSLSRLSRSVRDIVDLAEQCKTAGVPIHLVVDPDPDPTSPSGRMILTILSAMAQFEADVASERARDTAEARRARGEKLGPRFFEDTDAVVTAYETTGSFAGAAKLLTSQGVRTRNGLELWQPSSVSLILQRVAPELLPDHQPRGTKKAAPFAFYRLLRCHCGRILTGVRYLSGSQAGYVTYRCLQGRFLPNHGAQSVPETRVLKWARQEAALLAPPQGDVSSGEDQAEKRNALRDRKNRLGRAFVDGLLAEPEYQAEKRAIDKELDEIDAAGRVRSIPGGIRWDVEPKVVNDQLRALWEYVELDDSMNPVRAEWKVPEWRADPEHATEPAGAAAAAA